MRIYSTDELCQVRSNFPYQPSGDKYTGEGGIGTKHRRDTFAYAGGGLLEIGA